jgi:hypothetical protein
VVVVSDVDDEELVVGVFVVESNCDGVVEDTTTELEVVELVVLAVDDVLPQRRPSKIWLSKMQVARYCR